MAFMLTRIQVDDYETWKTSFDSDPPGARKAATSRCPLIRGWLSQCANCGSASLAVCVAGLPS